MKYGTPFVIDTSVDELENHSICNTDSDSTFNWQKTNVWNSSFNSPEISCDFELLHNDIKEIKQLICDIKECLKEFFTPQTE